MTKILSAESVRGHSLQYGPLLGTFAFHYSTVSISPLHYLSMAFGGAIALLTSQRARSLSLGFVIILTSLIVMLADALWFGSLPLEFAIECLALAAIPSLVLWRGARLAAPTAASHQGNSSYYWDEIRHTAMDKYLRGVEASFISARLGKVDRAMAMAADIGAGSGRHTGLLASVANSVIATEINPHLLSDLANVAPNVLPVLANAGADVLPLSEESTDCIICIEAPDVSHHDWFFNEARRVLRPGGIVLVTLHNRASWKGLMARAGFRRYVAKFGAQYYAHSITSYLSIAEREGFQLAAAHGFNWLPFSRDSNCRLIPFLARAERLIVQLSLLARFSPWLLLELRLPPSRDELSQDGFAVTVQSHFR